MLQNVEEELVRAALAELLKWEELRRSPQLTEFLRYVTEAALQGEQSKIKAYAIAVDVLGRSPSFDPQTDPIVRVQGGRLRGLLDKFYLEGRNKVPLRIRIPLGRYVPEFESLLEAHENSSNSQEKQDFSDSVERIDANTTSIAANNSARSPESTSIGDGKTEIFTQETLTKSVVPDALRLPGRFKYLRRRLAYIGAAVLFVGITGWLALMVWMPPTGNGPDAESHVPLVPIINVGTFNNLTGDPELNEPAWGLSLQLIADLSRFNDLIVHRHEEDDHPEDTEGRPAFDEYELSGVVRRGNYGLEFSMLLTDVVNGEVVWTTSISEPALTGDYPLLIGRVSRVASGALGSHRGPMHNESRRWVATHIDELKEPTQYICLLLFSLARDGQDAQTTIAAEDCFEHLLARNPDSATALAGWAGLDALLALREALPGDTLSDRLFDATHAVRHARDLMPHSSFVRAQLARVLSAQAEWDEARREYVSAVQRNPSDVDIRAEFALMLAYGGEWQVGNAQMEIALSGSPVPPPWHYALRAINGLRDKDYDAAIANALVIARADTELGVILALSAAPLAARSDIVERFAPEVIANPDFKTYGILPRLSLRIRDENTLRMIGFGLLLAGVPVEIISYPFTSVATAGR